MSNLKYGINRKFTYSVDDMKLQQSNMTLLGAK